MSRSSVGDFGALWRAYGEGRLEHSLDLVDPECEFVWLDDRRYAGHDGVRRWLAEVRRDWKSLTVSYDEVHEVRDGCVIAAGHVAAASTDGERMVEGPLVCVLEFRDGRLRRGRAFAGRDAARRYADALGRDG